MPRRRIFAKPTDCSGNNRNWPPRRRRPANPFSGIDGVSTSVDGNEVIVKCKTSCSIRATALKTREEVPDQIADVLNADYAGKMIIINGHTDSDPIRKSGFKSIHHLGFERGWAVYEYPSIEVKANRMAVSTWVDSPLDSKKESRRVEIVVAD